MDRPLTHRLLDALTSRWFWRPAPVEAVAPTNEPDLPALPLDRPFTVVCWNVQFCAGRTREFFYDGGTAVSVPTREVLETCRAIADALTALGADVALLQEVDRGARRTGGVDELAELVAHGAWPAWASTPYYRSRYVPVPAREPLGPMSLHLVTLSRFRLARARRHALAPMRESWLRQQFNLRRAALEVGLPIAGGGELVTVNAHLSAFSRGDGTLARQLIQCDAVAAAAATAGHRVILAGDFNALPPGDDPSRLPDPGEYAEKTSPITPLLTRWSTPCTPAAYAADPASLRTYLPWGSDVPDRTLDWLLHGPGVVVEDYRVERRFAGLSDHLPIVAKIRLTPGRP